MSAPVFLRLIPQAMQQAIINSLRGSWTPDADYRAYPDGQIKRIKRPNSSAYQGLTLSGDLLTKRLKADKSDDFNKITGVRFAKGSDVSLWLTGTPATDPVLDSKWLSRLLSRNGLTDYRELPVSAVNNPERYDVWKRLRQTITDVFEGFFPSDNTP